MIPQNVRLDKTERAALMHALKDVDDEVYLTGSRLAESKKGGDIDILIFSKKNSFELSRQISRRFFLECEEKIDVLAFDRENLTEEQEEFIKNLELLKIK